MPILEPIGQTHHSTQIQRRMQRLGDKLTPTQIVFIYLILFAVLNHLTGFWESLNGQTLWYAPMGLSIALVMRWGWQYAPALLAGRLLCDLLIDPLPVPLWGIFSLSFIYALGYGFAAYVLRSQLRIEPQIQYLREVSLFVLVILLTLLAIAGTGTLVLIVSQAISSSTGFAVLLAWLRSELIGVLAVAPFVLVNLEHWITVWSRNSKQPYRWRLTRSASQSWGILAIQGAILIGLVFVILHFKSVGEIHLLYFCFLPLIWLCFQYQFKGATAGAIAISTILGVKQAVYNTSELAELQIFMIALTLTGLFTGAAMSENAKVQEELRKSEEQFRQFAENIPQVFRMTSPDGQQIIYVSPAYQEIWGRSCQSLHQSPHSWIEAIHPQDRPVALAAQEKHLQGESTSEEYRILRPDGSMRWIWNRTFPIRNERGEVYRIAALAQDITEHKQVEEEALNAMAKEKELSELRTRIITTTSHEFRTPLTTIFSAAELLEYYSQRWTEQEKLAHLRQIQESVHHMTQLLDDLLFIGRAEAQQLQFKPISLDLVQFCQDLVAQIQKEALPQHKIIFTCQETVLQAEADPKLLRQILTNLLNNSILYSAPKTSIYLKLTASKDEAIFKVKDAGIGIPLEDQPLVFKSFHRGKNIGNQAGTGLGLTVVKKCVDLHQGRISFQSEVGVGTTFVIRLPQQHTHSQKADVFI